MVLHLPGIGGIQSSLCNLINEINDAYEIDLCVLGNRITNESRIPDSVGVIHGSKIIEYCISNYHSVISSMSLIQKIVLFVVKVAKRILGYKFMLDFALRFIKPNKEYDVAISYTNDIYSDEGFHGGCNDYVSKCVLSKKKLAWVHNDPNKHGLTSKICLSTYKNYDGVVFVSNACRDMFVKIVPEFIDKTHVVYNMINKDELLKLASAYSPNFKDTFNIVTVARLDNKQKRIDRIIDCCELLNDKGYKGVFMWTVIGNGPDNKYLIDMAFNKGVCDSLLFAGWNSNPYPYMKGADVFVLASDYEAYSMVLIETLAVGTPIICTNYPGADEVIENDINGLLTEMNAKSLCEAIENVIENDSVLERLRKNINKSELGTKLPLYQFNNLLASLFV